MRCLIVSALALLTASCAWLPPPVAATAPPPAPAPVALVPPPPAAPPPVATVAPAPGPWFFPPFAWLSATPRPGRLTLSNFTYDNARVEFVVTGAPDCGLPAGTAPQDFVLPLNGTRVIEADPGADVCWRRALAAGSAPRTARASSGWTGWNRAFLSSGRSVDSQL